MILNEMDKTTVNRAFNTHFFEMMDDVIRIYPDNLDIKAGRSTFENIKKMNPTTLIKCWHQHIAVPYAEKISSGDLTFFIEKNYDNDIAQLPNQRELLNIIDNLKVLFVGIDDANKTHMVNYLTNLNKLSFIYAQPR